MGNNFKKTHIGVMQGRLTPSEGRGIQFMISKGWENEFLIAKDIGLENIELNLDYPGFKNHAIWSATGRKKISNLSKKTGIKNSHLSLDIFMKRPFFRVKKQTSIENVKILNKIIKFSSEIGIKNIEIPLLDNSSIKTESEKEIFRLAIMDSLKLANNHGIAISLETDLHPKKFLKFVGCFNHPAIRIVYDTGNSAGAGYSPKEELETFGKYVSNVHIKDKKLHGKTIRLGDGDTDFNQIFSSLSKIKYSGDFVLQVARGQDYSEKQTIISQKNFVEKLINTYFR